MIRTDRCAAAIACIIVNSIFSMSLSGPEVTTRISASPSSSPSTRSGKKRRSSSAPVLNDQSFANASESWCTTGPRSRKCVSDTGWRGCSASMLAAAMFMPPAKPTSPSTTSTFLWVRRLMKGIRHGSTECMKRAVGTPPARSRSAARQRR